MSYCCCRRSIDAHFGEKCWEVFGLDSVALFAGETRCSQGILDHHFPNGAESDTDVFASERRLGKSLLHILGLLNPVVILIMIDAGGG
jgi:hypothetical protein